MGTLQQAEVTASVARKQSKYVNIKYNSWFKY